MSRKKNNYSGYGLCGFLVIFALCISVCSALCVVLGIIFFIWVFAKIIKYISAKIKVHCKKHVSLKAEIPVRHSILDPLLNKMKLPEPERHYPPYIKTSTWNLISDTECIQDVSKMEAQVRIGKDSIVEDRKDVNRKPRPISRKREPFDPLKYAVECNAYVIKKEREEEQNKICNFSHVVESSVPAAIVENTIKDFDSMTGTEFEIFCANLLKRNGYINVSGTKASGDQGIDILAQKDGVRYGIQCKCFSGNVGNSAVQEAYAGKTFYNCHVAVVLTNRQFTESAVELANKNGVLLWSRGKLLELMKNTEESQD